MSGSPEVRSESTIFPDVGQQDDRSRRTLGQVFDPRANALNAWRLALALAVIVWHSLVLTGHPMPPFAVHQFATQDFVDGFFAISGFLIPASWLSNPRLRDYVLARSLRILPGMWVCLVITAFVIAPIGVAIQGGSAAKLLTSGGPLQFVVRNSAVAYVQFDIAGTPSGIPFPGMWNGSLWTLQYEVLLYIAVARSRRVRTSRSPVALSGGLHAGTVVLGTGVMPVRRRDRCAENCASRCHVRSRRVDAPFPRRDSRAVVACRSEFGHRVVGKLAA